jgi:hypothetical protein
MPAQHVATEPHDERRQRVETLSHELDHVQKANLILSLVDAWRAGNGADDDTQGLVDAWVLYDNSETVPVLLDWGEKR